MKCLSEQNAVSKQPEYDNSRASELRCEMSVPFESNVSKKKNMSLNYDA